MFLKSPVLILFILVALCWSMPAFASELGKRGDLSGSDRLGNIKIGEIEFKNAKVRDAVRVISELTGVNIVATGTAGEKLVTLFVRNLTVADVVDSLCRISGLWYRHNPGTGVFIVMTAEEYQKDIVVFRNEPTRMFQLKYLNVGIAARTIADLFGERVELLGKANQHYGNDFRVGETFDSFAEDYDKAEMDEDEDDDDDDRDKEIKYIRSKRKDTDKATDLTTAQLSWLEDMARKELQAVSEGLIGQVSERIEAPIYVTINRLHNMLFVRTADEKAMEEIARIVEDSDRQVPEVLLEMKVLEVELTDQFQSAFDISQISGSEKTGPADGQVVNPLNPSSASVGSSLLGLGNFGLMESPTLVFQALSDNLRMRLQLLARNDNLQALATPMLLAANNHPARLFIGEETVLTTGFESQAIDVSSDDNVIINTVPVPETEVRSIGNTLTILPSINADRSVVMRIVHENSTVSVNGGRIPLLVDGAVQSVPIDTVNTSTLEGTVLAQDGMTVAVGGMMRTTQVENESKVPVLGDIPLLGFFFKQKEKSEVKTELVLLITPHVLSAPEEGEAVTRRRLSELTEHPNGIDVYLDNLDREREERGGNHLSGAVVGQHPAPDAAAGIGGLEKSFIELVSVAARQVRTPDLLRQPQGRVRPAELRAPAQVLLFPNPGIVASPTAAWTDGYHFVTALKIENRSGRAQKLDVGEMAGDWHAATLEQQELAPAGAEGDFTYLYLISDREFETAFLGAARQ
jgi:Flp pilus assembly secretin CpaC